MSPAGWLLVAATALILVAGWSASVQAAMARINNDELARYGSLLTLIRVCAEVSAQTRIRVSRLP